MGSWFDLIAFALTLVAFVGVILGVRAIVQQVSSTVAATKESLRDRGLTVSDKGVSVRTSSRYTREDYVDATQRGFIKAMGAASFSTAEGNDSSVTKLGTNKSSPMLSRHDSSASVDSTGSKSVSSDKEKKKRRFGFKKRNSDS